MVAAGRITVEIEPDPGQLIQFARLIQKHFGALADDLEQLRDGEPAEPRTEITEAGQ